MVVTYNWVCDVMVVDGMTIDPYKDTYVKVINLLGLENDPFPIVPPKIVDYWADNKSLLEKLKITLIDSLLFASSNIYIFWGDIGVGKTFAAKYLSGPKGIETFVKELPEGLFGEQLVIQIKAPQPRRTGELVSSIYRNIAKNFIDHIFKDRDLLKELMLLEKNMESGNIKRAFKALSRDIIVSIGNDVIITNIDNNEGYKYILDQKNKIGKIGDLDECADILKYLFLILYKKYEKITIIIDELENLASSTMSEKYQFNDFIKSIYRKIDVGLNIILIYTFNTFTDVKGTLQRPLYDRIKEIIEFKLISNSDDIIEYIEDCLSLRGNIDPYNFIEKDVIEEFSHKLIEKFGQISFRDINKEMHKLIATSYRLKLAEKKLDDNSFKITKKLFSLYSKLL
ncbi:MAG: hypothetical protein ACTSPW_14110 [Promethearchaeota archaeon]